ncbi:MAG TPA: LysR family transcriptional regulator [Nevskiales bacterium]|jgi:DNA-binding transcriptional LysR family regulator|nr:LysR family transcriptional regulator [Nevskiales bacterium]
MDGRRSRPAPSRSGTAAGRTGDAGRAPLDDVPALMRLRTRQLLLAALLGHERHLGRAAAALGVSQPAATRLLQELEETLGARLFERSVRGMTPTPAGEVLVRYARQVLNDFGSARRELAALAAGLHGTLRIGSVPSALPPLLAPALARFKAQHARVSVAIVVATSDVMLEQLARGEVELMLGRLVEGHYDDEHEAVPVLDEPQVVVARADHPLHASAYTGPAAAPTLRELARWPWVLQPPGSPQAGRFMAMMREAGVHRRIDITETASTVATTALLQASDMLAVMPASLATHYASLGVLRALPVSLPMRVPDIQLVWRRAREFSAPAAAFRDAVLAQAARTRVC